MTAPAKAGNATENTDMNAASIIRSKTVAVVSAGFLGIGLLGGIAFAATPITGGVVSSIVSDANGTLAEQDKRDGKLKAALDALVSKGVITKAQEDAVIAALHDGQRDHKDHPKLREFVGDVAKASADYLGIPADQLKDQLKAGKSLGQIANVTAGKSREGLLKALDEAAGKRIDAAVDAGKLTKDQATALRTKVDGAMVKIVDHTGSPKPKK